MMTAGDWLLAAVSLAGWVALAWLACGGDQ